MLVLEDDEFRFLRNLKAGLSSKEKKDLTWEDFLCRWVISLFQLWQKMTFDKAVEEALKDYAGRKEIEKIVRNCINAAMGKF
jgi:hypothetical protein